MAPIMDHVVLADRGMIVPVYKDQVLGPGLPFQIPEGLAGRSERGPMIQFVLEPNKIVPRGNANISCQLTVAVNDVSQVMPVGPRQGARTVHTVWPADAFKKGEGAENENVVRFGAQNRRAAARVVVIPRQGKFLLTGYSLEVSDVVCFFEYEP